MERFRAASLKIIAAVFLTACLAAPAYTSGGHEVKPPPREKSAQNHSAPVVAPTPRPPPALAPDPHAATAGPPSPIPPAPAKPVVVVVPPGGHGDTGEGVSPEDVLKRLMEGNRRFALDAPVGPDRSQNHRLEIAEGQKPFAIIVTCSDSRLPPELIFDQGFGDVFVVRSAGNVVDDVALGSIEYALDHLGVKLIVVLGHTRCGAVKATLEGGELTGHLPAIAALIVPAVEKARAKSGDLMPNAVRANVKMVAQKIVNAAPGLAEKVEDGEIGVIGGVYDLESGKVELTYKPLM